MLRFIASFTTISFLLASIQTTVAMAAHVSTYPADFVKSVNTAYSVTLTYDHAFAGFTSSMSEKERAQLKTEWKELFGKTLPKVNFKNNGAIYIEGVASPVILENNSSSIDFHYLKKHVTISKKEKLTQFQLYQKVKSLFSEAQAYSIFPISDAQAAGALAILGGVVATYVAISGGLYAWCMSTEASDSRGYCPAVIAWPFLLGMALKGSPNSTYIDSHLRGHLVCNMDKRDGVVEYRFNNPGTNGTDMTISFYKNADGTRDVTWSLDQPINKFRFNKKGKIESAVDSENKKLDLTSEQKEILPQILTPENLDKICKLTTNPNLALLGRIQECEEKTAAFEAELADQKPVTSNVEASAAFRTFEDLANRFNADFLREHKSSKCTGDDIECKSTLDRLHKCTNELASRIQNAFQKRGIKIYSKAKKPLYDSKSGAFEREDLDFSLSRAAK